MVEWFQNKKGGLSLRYYLAIDIGASSGRHIVGWQKNGEIKTNEVYRFEKPLHKQVTIKRQLEKERRLVVMMNIKIGKETLTVPFSLADRENFNYPVLIGRNILTGRAIVDTAKSETLY